MLKVVFFDCVNMKKCIILYSMCCDGLSECIAFGCHTCYIIAFFPVTKSVNCENKTPCLS